MVRVGSDRGRWSAIGFAPRGGYESSSRRPAATGEAGLGPPRPAVAAGKGRGRDSAHPFVTAQTRCEKSVSLIDTQTNLDCFEYVIRLTLFH